MATRMCGVMVPDNKYAFCKLKSDHKGPHNIVYPLSAVKEWYANLYHGVPHNFEGMLEMAQAYADYCLEKEREMK